MFSPLATSVIPPTTIKTANIWKSSRDWPVQSERPTDIIGKEPTIGDTSLTGPIAKAWYRPIKARLKKVPETRAFWNAIVVKSGQFPR